MKKVAKEKILSRRVLIDKKPYLEVVELQYRDAYGAEHKYISVDRPGAVAIAAITENDELILIKQFRPPIGKYVLSLPAGLIDKDKGILDIAKDELLEEAGFVAKEWRLVESSFNSAGILNEEVYLFLATKLDDVGARNNVYEGESIGIIKMPFSGKSVGSLFRLAREHGCIVESNLVAHFAMIKALLR